MRVGVCGVACEKCPRMAGDACPSGEAGCRPKDNPFCAVATCAHRKGFKLCFKCPKFPYETTKRGPIDYPYCMSIAGKGG